MTALSATVVHAAGTTPPRVTLAVTGAPNPPASSYTANFTATTDGWAAGGGATVVRDGTHGTGALRVTGAAGAYAEKTIAGLSVGVEYKFRAWAHRVSYSWSSGGDMRMSVRTTGGVEIATTGRNVGIEGSWMEVKFTASATSHVFRFNLAGTNSPDWYVDTTSVAGNWAGTRLYRTDANGVDAIVRLTAGHDTAGGTMTVEDWEPALVGNITYRVLDGTGAAATAATVSFTTPGVEAADGLWFTRPDTSASNAGAAGAPAAFHPYMVDSSSYKADRAFLGTVHQVIGRADPVSNPGPMSMRRGPLGVLCTTYADALALAALFQEGQPLRMLQPRLAGMDMLFTATDVGVAPASSTWVPWTVTLTYSETRGAFL